MQRSIYSILHLIVSCDNYNGSYCVVMKVLYMLPGWNCLLSIVMFVNVMQFND